MSYPFLSIWINGRSVTIENIIRAKVSARSTFEETTFLFIREWFLDKEKFTLQTSGSTGEAKAITITREQMIASAKLTENALQLQPLSNALVCIDTKYIGGKMMLVRSFITGMKIFATDPCACPLHKIPVDLCVNFAAFVPYQVKSTLGSKHPHLLNDLDVLIIGGAPLDARTVDQLESLLCRCYATYGMTETVSHIALQGLNGKWKSDYFKTLPKVKVENDARGCLVISAPYLSEKIITNDLTKIVSSEEFKWLGRWDNVINTAGYKVSPEKIEEDLTKIFKLLTIENRFFIYGIDDDKLGSKVTLIIEGTSELKSKAEAAVAEFRRHASSLYEVPKEIIFVPSFVMTESGKVNRLKTVETIDQVLSLKK